MKKLLVGLAVVFAAMVSQASYLYWQVLSDSIGDFSGDNYQLFAKNGDSVSRIGFTTELDTAHSANLSGYEGENFSFYVEIFNNGSAIARSAETTYADLSGNFTGNLESIPSVGIWHASNYSAVPEPTTGMMMMIGLAFLGLKRRKA